MEQRSDSQSNKQIYCDCDSKSEMKQTAHATHERDFRQNPTTQPNSPTAGMKHHEPERGKMESGPQGMHHQHGQHQSHCEHHKFSPFAFESQKMQSFMHPHHAFHNPFIHPHVGYGAPPYHYQPMNCPPFDMSMFAHQNPQSSFIQKPHIGQPHFSPPHHPHPQGPQTHTSHQGFDPHHAHHGHPYGYVGYYGHGHHCFPCHHKHMESSLGMAINTVNRIMSGQAQPEEIFSIFSVDFNHEQFWKGLIAGSLLAFLITNKSVREGISNLFASETNN